MLAQRPLSDPQAVIASGSNERPILAESSRWRSGQPNDRFGSFPVKRGADIKRLLMRGRRSTGVRFFGPARLSETMLDYRGKVDFDR